MEKESSFISGMTTTTGAILTIFIILVVAPCAVCGGMATCGKVLEEAESGNID